MARFMMAMNINQETKKEHPDVTHQVDMCLEIFREHELKVERVFATLGRYDYLVLFEADDQDEAEEAGGLPPLEIDMDDALLLEELH